MTVISASQVLTPAGLVRDAWIEVEGERIKAWGSGRSPEPAAVSCNGLLCPGFVDAHSHGGGGVNFGDGIEDARKVLATHLSHGTTTMMASLVTGTLDSMERSIRELTPLVDSGELAGIHLEGPWLAPEYKGAHEASLLQDPKLADVQRLAGAGPVRMVTIAPERPGAMAAIDWLVGQGIVVAVGHTAADDACAREAIARGATGATHLFNAMPEMLHRQPGPVLPLWASPDVWVELVFDGVHVAPDLARHVMTTKPSHAVLITDAMAAAGIGDGDFALGSLLVEVRQGVAHLAGTTTIAGSTLTINEAVRVAVRAGVPVETALMAATFNPASYLGFLDLGRFEPGNYADAVVLDDSLTAVKVMRHGTWI